MGEEINKQVKKEVVLQALEEQTSGQQGEYLPAAQPAELATASAEKDGFTEELLATVAIKGEFMAYKDKVLAYIDKKDEKVIEEHRPVMRQLFRVGDTGFTEPSGLADLKTLSETEGSIQKLLMDSYTRYFKLEDFTAISKAFEKGPSEDAFAGKVVKQSYEYMQFLSARMRLGQFFESLTHYRPDEMEADQILLLDKFKRLFERDMDSNRLNPEQPINEQIRLMNVRLGYFMDFARDSVSIYHSTRNKTKTGDRVRNEELRAQSREFDSEVEYSYEDYLSEMGSFMAEFKEADSYAGAFADGSMEAGMEDLMGACRQSTQSYAQASENLRLCLEGISVEHAAVVDRVKIFCERLELMNGRIKKLAADSERAALDDCRNAVESCRRMREDGETEDIPELVEDTVENYHRMFANRSIALKIERACTRILDNIYTVLNASSQGMESDESCVTALTELLNVMPVMAGEAKVGDMDDEAIQTELKSSLMLTELLETRFTNDSFMQTPETMTMDVNADLEDLLARDPNKYFDQVLDYYAPAVKNGEADSPYSNEALEQSRKECLVEIERGRQYLAGLGESEFSNEAVKSVCVFMQDKIEAVEKSFEKTNNHFINILQISYEKGSGEAAAIALQGLKTMMSELRDYSKCMNYMVRQLKDFVALTKNFEAAKAGDYGTEELYDPMEQLKDMLSTLTGSLSKRIIYTPEKDDQKFFESPYMVHGQLLELTGFMQLITGKAKEIMAGKVPFEDVERSSRVLLRARSLEEAAAKSAVKPEDLAMLKRLKEQIAELEKKGELFGQDQSYRTELSIVQAKYEAKADAVKRLGAIHNSLVQKKLELEKSLYRHRITVSAATEAEEEKERRSRVLAVAEALVHRNIVREQADLADMRQLGNTQKKRAKAMEKHLREEARAKIAEEKRQKELLRAEEEERRYDERMAQFEARKEALLNRAREIKSAVVSVFRTNSSTEDYVDPATLKASERLTTYIPKNATGRLKDYTLKGKKVKGVGKLESIGSCASSKLKERMSKHTLRFLYSENVNAVGINATADSIIKGAGFISKDYQKSKAPVMEELRLIDSINACTNCDELKDIIKTDACRTSAAGNGDDLIALSDRYVDRNFVSAKVILMHRLFNNLVITPGSIPDLSQKELTSLYERVDAAKENMRLLYNHCISRPEYAEERAAVLEDEARGIEARITEERPHGLQLKAYKAALKESEEAAVNTMYDTAEAVSRLDADAKIRAKNLREANAEKKSRERQLAELTRAVNELAENAEREQQAEFRSALISQGRLRNGKYVTGWLLDRFADRVEAYIDKNLADSADNIIELAVIGYNERCRENMEAVQAYLNSRLLGGGDFEYLKNPALRAVAERDLLDACGDAVFTASSRANMSKKLASLSARKVFRGYMSSVSRMLAGIRKEKSLEPYAEAVMVNERYLEAVKSREAGQISEVLTFFKKNVEANEGLIRDKLAGLSYEQRLILETNIKARLGRQILSASPESVINIIQREIDYQNLLNPVEKSSASAVVKKAKELYAEPDEAMLNAVSEAIETSRKLAEAADEEDHYESDSDYAEYEILHSVGLSLMFSHEDLQRYCLEKLAYYRASTNKTMGLKAKAMQFIRDFAVERSLDYTISDLEKANGGELSAAERILAREMFAEGKLRKAANGEPVNARLRNLLSGMSVKVTPLVKALTPYLYEKKIVSSDSFDSLTAGDVYELVDYAFERLSPLLKALEQKESWANSSEIKLALLERCLDTQREAATVGQLTVIATNEHARLADAKDILSVRKNIMSLGNCWASKKVSVDLVNRKLNSARNERQFRDLNRIGRARNLAHEMTKFCEKNGCASPISIFEFAELEENSRLSEDEVFTKWKNEAIFGTNGWIGGEANKLLKKAKEDFYHGTMHEKQGLHNLRLYAYYGMFDDFSVILKGLGDSINDDQRESFERKLFEVGRTYQRRKKYFEETCRDYHLNLEESKALLPNVSEYFADAPETVKNRSEEEREKSFRDYIRTTVAMASRYEYNISMVEKRGGRLEKDEKYRAVAMRKDERIGRLSFAKAGIFAPIIPVLVQDREFQEKVLTYADDAYRQYEIGLMKKLEEPMQLLSEEGTVYNSFIDQFIIRFKAELIGEKMLPNEDWATSFNRYYMEITDHNYGSEANPLSISSIIYDASMKAAKASGKKRDKKLDGANMVIHVLLNEGVSGVLDKSVFEKYRENLRNNSKVLERELSDFYESEEFKSYIEHGKLQQKMGYEFGSDPEKLLKKIFTASVRMAEREFLVKETLADYEEHLPGRLQEILGSSLATLDTATNLTRISRQTDEMMDSTVVEAKREGRRIMRAEREALAEYENLAEFRISPVMAACMKKTVKLSTQTAHQVETFRKNMSEKLAGAGDTKSLAIEIGAAYAAEGQTLSPEQMQVCNDNLERLMARLSAASLVNENQKRIIFIRMAMKAGDPFAKWSLEHIDKLIGEYKEDTAVSGHYAEIIKLEAALPKDGCLDSYYRSARAAATYIAVNGKAEGAAEELEKIYTLLAKRTLMLNVINNFISSNEETLTRANAAEFKEREKLALRAGLFDYFAAEIANADVKYDEAEIRMRMTALLADCISNRQLRDYLVNDTGRRASIASDQTIAENGDSEYGSALARAKFENRLRSFIKDKSCGELVRQYFELAAEERTLFAHMAASLAVNSVSDMSMSFAMAYGERSSSKEADFRVGREYVDSRMITAAADYQTAERAVFFGKQPDQVRLKTILASVKAKHKEMLKKNVDMKLLANSSKEARAVLGKAAITEVDSVQSFKKVLRSLSAADSPENQLMIERLVKLRPYELQLLAMILSDRTAVDTALDSKEPVNAERSALIKRSLRMDVAGSLADVRAGGELMNKALASLCSYRVREDRVILGPLTKDDLMGVERETAIDYELLKNAFRIMDENHPESLIHSALRYSYEEVKSAAATHGNTADGRIAAYAAAKHDITKPELLVEYLRRTTDGELSSELKAMNSEEQKLFIYLLANRGAVDESTRFNGKTADEDMREKIAGEYIEQGTVAIDTEVFEDALAGIYSKQMDDAVIASDMKADITAAFADKRRNSPIDFRLLARALTAVREIAEMRIVHEQNRLDSIFGK